jgi:hypothetical protein
MSPKILTRVPIDYSTVKKAVVDTLIRGKVAKLMHADPQLDENEATAQLLNSDDELYAAYRRTSSVNGTSDD